MYNLIVGGFRDSITPRREGSERQKLHIVTVLGVKTIQRFDYDFGSVEYIAVRRKKVITFTFALNDQILFVSTDQRSILKR